MYTKKDPCSIDEALEALERAVQEEKLVDIARSYQCTAKAE